MDRLVKIGIRFGCLLSLAVAALPAQADVLLDPTRPANAAPTATGSDGAASQNAFGLQSIVRKPGRLPRALIGGEWVEQGGLYAGERVLRITADSVILRQVVKHGPGEKGVPGERRVLRLNPDVEKLIAPASTRDKRGEILK